MSCSKVGPEKRCEQLVICQMLQRLSPGASLADSASMRQLTGRRFPIAAVILGRVVRLLHDQCCSSAEGCGVEIGACELTEMRIWGGAYEGPATARTGQI